MRWILLLLALLPSALPSTVRAQDEQEEAESESESPWRLSYFPYLTGHANDGPVLGARLRYWQPAPYEARVTATGALNADVGATAQGTRYARAEFYAPMLREGWRLNATVLAAREARFGYYGIGNETTFDHDLVTDAQPFLYRVRRTRYEGRAELSRQIRGPLWAAFLGEVEAIRFSTLPGPSIFATDFGPETRKEDDVSGRLALVYDTRDVEYNTRQGVLLEAGAQVGSGGGNYTRLYAALRGYLAVREGTVIAARVAGSGMGGDPPLNARFTIPTWEQPVLVLGGVYSHRALDIGRLAGQHVLFGNLEVRHDLLNLGDLGALTLLAFADAGRVFEEEPFRLTTDEMKVGGGGGIALRILRSTIFTFNFAGGPDGFNFSVGNGWMF
jgi:outer membrane protein assembly factor BamA